jgi:hypothetical protein
MRHEQQTKHSNVISVRSGVKGLHSGFPPQGKFPVTMIDVP